MKVYKDSLRVLDAAIAHGLKQRKSKGAVVVAVAAVVYEPDSPGTKGGSRVISTVGFQNLDLSKATMAKTGGPANELLFRKELLSSLRAAIARAAKRLEGK